MRCVDTRFARPLWQKILKTEPLSQVGPADREIGKIPTGGVESYGD